jgi:hypothetical protein
MNTSPIRELCIDISIKNQPSTLPGSYQSL